MAKHFIKKIICKLIGQKWKFPIAMSVVTTFAVTFVLVSINYGYGEYFFWYWMRSWAVAGLMVACSIRYLGPRIARMINR
jgi:tellurite resistance protein TehA-like permease